MEPLLHAPDAAHLAHLQEARRVLALPIAASGLHWHPFGVFGIPLASRTIEGRQLSRRLHIWHPDTTPVGETSIYGVHTHSGTAMSHVLVGTLQHHLYEFETDPDGIWIRTARQDKTNATLRAHVQGPTHAGVTHTLPANHAHGVSKPPGFAISLFEQVEEGRAQPFTTWQRTDAPAEVLVTRTPLDVKVVQAQALALVEEALYLRQ